MTGSAKRKGDKAEREIAGELTDLLGLPVRRMLGAGRQDDVGDLEGIPDTVVQVVNWRDVAAALRIKPQQSEEQQANAGATFGATAVRLPRGRWLFALTPTQYVTYVREALREESVWAWMERGKQMGYIVQQYCGMHDHAWSPEEEDNDDCVPCLRVDLGEDR